MSPLNNNVIPITKDELAKANETASHINFPINQKRAIANILAANLGIKFLLDFGIHASSEYSLHKITNILKDTDIADIYANNIKIDVRLIDNANEIFIPKSQFLNEVQPDLYMIFKIEEDLSGASFIGYIPTENIDKNLNNSDYYFVRDEDLYGAKDLKTILTKGKPASNRTLDEKDIAKAKNLFLNLIDSDITVNDRLFLYNKLSQSIDLRKQFVDFENFEKISKIMVKTPEIMNDSVLAIAGNSLYKDKQSETDFGLNVDLDKLNQETTPDFSQNEEEKNDKEEEDMPEDNNLSEEFDNLDNIPEFENPEIDIEGSDKDILDMQDSNTEAILSEDIPLDDINLDALNEGIAISDEDLNSINAKDAGFEVAEETTNIENEGFEDVSIDDIPALDTPDDENITNSDNATYEDVSMNDNTPVVEEIDLSDVNLSNLTDTNDDSSDNDNIEDDDSEELNNTLELPPLEDFSDVINFELPEIEGLSQLDIEDPQEDEPQIEENEIQNNLENSLQELSTEENEQPNTLADIPLENDEVAEDVNPTMAEDIVDDTEAINTLDLNTENETVNISDVELDGIDLDKADVNIEETLGLENIDVIDIEDIETPMPSEEFNPENMMNSNSSESVETLEDNIDSAVSNNEEFLNNNISQELQTEETPIENTFDNNTEISDISLDDFVEDFQDFQQENNTDTATNTNVDEFMNLNEIPDFNDNTDLSSIDDITQEVPQQDFATDNLENIYANAPENESTQAIEHNMAALKNQPMQQPKKKTSPLLYILLLVVLIAAGVSKKDTLMPLISQYLPNQEVPTIPTPDMPIEGTDTNNTDDVISPDTIEEDVPKPIGNIPNDNTPSRTLSGEEVPSITELTSNADMPTSFSIRKVMWEVPEDLSFNGKVVGYLKTAGRTIKLSLQSELMNTTEVPLTQKIIVGITISGNGSISDIVMTKSSGSARIDKIVLQSVKNTLNYVKPPFEEFNNKTYDFSFIINL